MNNSLENAHRLSVKDKIKIVFVVALVIIVLFGIATVDFFAYISPPKDDIDFFDYPPEFFCKTEKIVSITRRTESVRHMPPHI